ncbi:MAG: hypothetical protein GY951_12600 [Psychromonas sp.]|nr:hypothetical protein [Psychromonas sp.]
MVLKDKRILLARLFVAFALFGSLIGIATAQIDSYDKIVLLLVFMIFAAINYLGISLIGRRNNSVIIFSLVMVYLWLAYLFKLVMTINKPELLWVSNHFFHENEVLNTITASFLTVYPGLISLLLGLMFFHRRRVKENRADSYKINHIIITACIISLLALRLFNQLVFNIGVPGVIPVNLGIPLVTGILELLTRPVLLVVVNFYFFSVLRLRDRRGLSIASLLVIANLLMGIRVGYKSELVIQGLLILYYIFECRNYLSSARRKIVYLICISFITFTVLLYPFVNHYRQYLLSGKDFSEAVDSAQQRRAKTSDIQGESTLFKIFNRLNGVGAYYAATRLGKGRDFTMGSLMTGEVMDLIKEKLYGNRKDEAVTAFGTTQFSVFYLVGGVPLVAIGGFFLGWWIRAISNFMSNRLFRIPFTFEAYLPLYCFLCIKFLNAGGNMSLYLKELALVGGALYILERLCFKRSKVGNMNLEGHGK